MKFRTYVAVHTALFVLTAPILLRSPVVRADDSAPKIDYTNPPQGVFADDWMRIELEGIGKVGYAHSEFSRQDDQIHSSTLLSIQLARAGQNVKIGVLQSAVETLAGAPESFSHQMDMSVAKMSVEGRIENGKVTVTSNQLGQSMTDVHDYPEGAVMSWGALLRQHKEGYKPGTTYTIKTYDPATAVNAALDLTVNIVGPEKISIDGKETDAILTKQIMKLPQFPDGVQTKAWLDAEGNVLRTNVQMAGMNMVMTRTTRTDALGQFDPPEFFMPTTIAIKQRIDRDAVKRIEYVIRSKNPNIQLPDIPYTSMQKSKRNEDGSLFVRVQRLDRNRVEHEGGLSRTQGFEQYLTANNMINSDDPAVREMAAEAAGHALEPYEICDRLRKYVSKNISAKNLNIGFATASEVCRNREGDCSEHAVLLAALGRAAGMPSRVVTGIVYVPVFGGRDDIFGFHMWTQFYIGEKWVDFDAALEQSDVDPTHIAFSVDSLDHGSLGQVAFPLVNVIGNLDLTIENVIPEEALITRESDPDSDS